jgi:hypothetical protein
MTRGEVRSMQGIVILTSDETGYRVGNVVETRGINFPPVAPNTTYIIHGVKVTEKEIKRWTDVVSYRMVFVIDKLPKLSKKIKEEIIVDKSLKAGSTGFKREVDMMFRWDNRTRVFTEISKNPIPIPLALSFLRKNRVEEIELWRLLSQTKFTLPAMYTEALLAYGVRPRRGMWQWPSKSVKHESPPDGFRESDKYWRNIIALDTETRNTLRTNNESLPKSVKKTQESVLKWV